MKGNRERTLAWVLCALCVLALCGTLSGCGGSRRLTLRVGAGEGSTWQTAASGFRDRVESGGHYKISIRQNAEPGSCDLELDSLLSMADRAPGLAAVSLPWLFPAGYEDADRALLREDGAGREAVFALLREADLEPLGLGENGFFQLTCDVRGLTGPADLAGVSLAAPEDGPLRDYLRTLGAVVETESGPDAFSALRDALLDGQSDTLDGIRADQSYLVQRYMTIWNCAYDPICLTASQSLWERLSAEDRTLFREAARAACSAQVDAVRSALPEALAEIRATGVEVTELDESEMDAFRAVTGPVYEKWRAILGDEALAAFGVTP